MSFYFIMHFIHHAEKLTSSEQVIDNPYNLLIRHLDIRVLIQLPVLTVLNKRVCDVSNVVLSKRSDNLKT